MGWLDADRCLVIAHRGARASAPENTLAAFRLAIEQGADGVELDVRASSDGHLVVIHDASVERVTGTKGEIAVMELAAIQRLDAGGGEHIPTLAEVLELARGRLLVDIELKISGIEQAVVDLVRTSGMEQDVLITSFHEDAVSAIRRLAPRLAVGLLQQWPVLERATALAVGVYLPNIRALSEDLVAASRQAGLRVIPWTVRRADEAEAALRFRVDGMIADDPSMLRGIVGAARG